MLDFFTTIFYQPILNLLIFLYNIIPGSDLAIAIILLTIIIKLLLYPLSKQALKGQKSLQEIQPKIEELKKKYANDREKMGKEMMQLYKDHKVNPLSSCLPLLLQLPFLIAVFHVFRNGFGEETLNMIYSFISTPTAVTSVIELSQPNWYLALLAGAAQFWQTKMMMAKNVQPQSGGKDESMAAIMNKQMVYFMPLITVFIGLTQPGGVALYLLVVTVLTALQQKMMFRDSDNKGDGNSSAGPKKTVEGEVVE